MNLFLCTESHLCVHKDQTFDCRLTSVISKSGVLLLLTSYLLILKVFGNGCFSPPVLPVMAEDAAVGDANACGLTGKYACPYWQAHIQT